MEEEKVILNEDGFKKFCQNFEKWMIGEERGTEKSFRQIIKQQAADLKKAIQNKQPYLPYRWEGTNEICN